MFVKFWGTRGSLPVALNADQVRTKIEQVLRAARGHALNDEQAIANFIDQQLSFELRGTYGGNTSCVQLSQRQPNAGSGPFLICDMGSGLRELGNHLMPLLAQTSDPAQRRFDIFLSHLHWDHIMGFPFFAPAFLPDVQIRIHGCHEQLEQALRNQNSAPGFPVDFSALKANIEFVVLQPDTNYSIGGYTVRAQKQSHGGDSYAYRFDCEDHRVVYATDGEHKLDSTALLDRIVDFLLTPIWSFLMLCIRSPIQSRSKKIGDILATSLAWTFASAPKFAGCVYSTMNRYTTMQY